MTEDDSLQALHRKLTEFEKTISEQKQREEQVRQSEARLRDLFENIPIGIYRTTPDGKILSANRALLEMLGYDSFEEIADRNLEEQEKYEPEYSRKDFRERLERDDSIRGLETRWRRGDDSTITVRENATVVRDGQRNVLYYQGTVEDISDRKRAEQALTERERLAAFAAEIGAALILNVSLQEKLQQCAQVIITELGAVIVDVYTWNTQKGQLEPQASVTASAVPTNNPEHQEWVERIAKKESLVIDLTSVRPSEAVRAWAQQTRMGLFAGYPLVVEDRMLGVVTLYSPESMARTALETLASAVDEIAREIDRTWASEALQESEDRYRDLVENSDDLISTHDLNGFVLSVNRAMVRRTGYSQEELTGRDTRTFIPPDSLDLFERYLATIRKDGHAQGHLRIITRSGEERVLEYQNSLRKEGLDQPIVRSICHDVTLQKKAEKALLDSEMKFRSVVQAAREAIVLADQDGNIILWNLSAQHIFGYEENEVLGQPLTILMSERYKEAHRKGLERVKSTGESSVMGKTLQAHGLKKDGREFPVEISISSWRSRDGIFFSGILRDITERKEIERMKNEFISVASHELRTPLTSIQGSLSWMQEKIADQLPERARKMIDIATKSSERMMRLIRDMLDIDKIESGKMVFDLKPLELGPLVQQAIDANQSYAAKFGVKLRVQSVLPGVKVHVDSDRFMQVLANLLSNATKFSPSGEEVMVSMARHESRIRVSVTDSGPGIPEKFRPHIFGKFSQSDSLGPRQKGGSGLGLSISKAIIERFGGKIGFVTETRAGVTFYFDLPEWKEGMRRILLCDDDPDLLCMIRDELQDQGFEVVTTDNGNEVLELLGKQKFDLVLLDALIPGLHGFEVCRTIKSRPETNRIPVIMMSGVFAKSDKASEIGAEEFITKPFDLEFLTNRIKHWLAR